MREAGDEKKIIDEYLLPIFTEYHGDDSMERGVNVFYTKFGYRRQNNKMTQVQMVEETTGAV